ncbi:MAG: hypothetical protein KC594_18835, partial [Nitrospira sp.]|nr:hypothetical protein [Nitrospira sp.]
QTLWILPDSPNRFMPTPATQPSQNTNTENSLDEEVARRLISQPGQVRQGIFSTLTYDHEGLTQRPQAEIKKNHL